MKKFDELSQRQRDIIGCTSCFETPYVDPRTAAEIHKEFNKAQHEHFIFHGGNGGEKKRFGKLTSFFSGGPMEPKEVPLEEILADMKWLEMDGWLEHPPSSPRSDILPEECWVRTEAALLQLLGIQTSNQMQQSAD